jgi:choline dehydrogenase
VSAASSYDYVIAGGGAAGCVVAARLSEDPEVSVLLLEAGPPDTLDNIRIPLSNPELLHSPVDWDFSTGAEEFCDGRRITLPRGRTLGGSSSINGMNYIRGNPLDYDSWRDAGCTGWGWDDLQPYFERSVKDLTISDSRWRDAATEAFVEAAVEAGHDRNDDFNSGNQDGFGFYKLMQRDGRRCSSADAFLRPALGRPNLTVETDMLVLKVLFEGAQAVGVECFRNGTAEFVSFGCEREVILSGGAYNSPQILMSSGIGPADHLATRMIETIADRPMVGRNLQDHVQFWPSWATDRPSELRMALQNPEANLAEFESEGRGPLTSNGGEGGGFFRTSADLPAPDFQIHTVPFAFGDEPVRGEVQDGVTLGICLLTPKSSGELFLAGGEITAKPVIYHRFFEEEEDLRLVEAAMETVYEIARRPALAPYCKTPYNLPASESSSDIRAWARRNALTLYHPVGTCAMGPGEEDVVDPELRVRGVEGLRVVDASVMPSVPRGNTNGPTVAMAERAADLIRGLVPSASSAPSS